MGVGGAGAGQGNSVEIHLLGTISYEEALALQQRLVFESTGRDDGQVWVLLCEHPELIAVGRRGSYGHIYFSPQELGQRGLQVRYVQHGGPCLVHGPGQLAVYAIVPLWWYGMSVGEHLRRLEQAAAGAIQELGIPIQRRQGHYGLWGRRGKLVHTAVAVRDWTTYFGLYVNVAPAMHLQRRVLSDPEFRSPPSCLLAERRHGVKMSRVRQLFLEHLARAWPCRRYHVYTHPPLLPSTPLVRESA